MNLPSYALNNLSREPIWQERVETNGPADDHMGTQRAGREPDRPTYSQNWRGKCTRLARKMNLASYLWRKNTVVRVSGESVLTANTRN